MPRKALNLRNIFLTSGELCRGRTESIWEALEAKYYIPHLGLVVDINFCKRCGHTSKIHT